MAEDKCECKSCLDELKKDYKKIQDKHNLPNFDTLNKEFQIEKVAECETDYLIREVRKFAAEKFSNYLRFIEFILNPMNAPTFIFSVIKTLGNEDKKKLAEIYKKLAKIEIKILELDVDFDEEKEAEFLRESYELWQEIKKELLDITNVIEKNWNNKFEANGGGYLG